MMSIAEWWFLIYLKEIKVDNNPAICHFQNYILLGIKHQLTN